MTSADSSPSQNDAVSRTLAESFGREYTRIQFSRIGIGYEKLREGQCSTFGKKDNER